MNEEILQKLQTDLEKRFPFGIPRKKLTEATGEVLHGRTEANKDSLGCGIEGRYMIGNQVIYPVQSVIHRIRTKLHPAIADKIQKTEAAETLKPTPKFPGGKK
ncbi:MAG: hypothetical protein PHP23_04670 [Desulfobacterales bacterium]|nr:hypothetical protein [Desulfobacterales bacterium]MDD4071662.1 hypothetical protein [Desulfobacterales bacterium]MDD4393573.1 hypothetical protein [Desulfobacterales bacterium]